MKKSRGLYLMALFVIAIFAATGCSESPGPISPTPAPSNPSPTPAPTPVQPVLAPPPAGVSSSLWLVGFSYDMKLHRPADGRTIHLDVSVLPPNLQSIMESVARVATGHMDGRQHFDTIPGDGINVTVTVVNGPIEWCGVSGGACTLPALDSVTGEVVGGIMQFTSANIILYDRPGILHEIFRTMGIVRIGPAGSIMVGSNLPQEPTQEDLTMLRGRYSYPLLSVYSSQ